MIKILNAALRVIAVIVLFITCRKEKNAAKPEPFSITNNKIILNPTGYSPLTATISVESSATSKVRLTIAGRYGDESNIVKEFGDIGSNHEIPVVGLYPDYANPVLLTFYDQAGIEIGHLNDTIKTPSLPAGAFPAISIDVKKDGLIAKGMTLVNYFGYKDSTGPLLPFIFDEFGEIRWYLDFTNHPVLNKLFYDNGPERLKNGNLYFGDTNSGAIYEVDMLGDLINSWDLPGYNFHHNVQEKPNGNFLVTVNKLGSSTIEDYIIEIDRNSKQIIRTWDLNSSLQYSRQTMFDNLVDWIHVNAVVYDESDNTIIVSGRTQGLIKLDENNNVVWIMAPHVGWGISGSGADLNNYLLQPLDKDDVPIPDSSVLTGSANHPDFEWNWYQHAPLVKPDGNIMFFDNGGDNRNFLGESGYSRAAEYKINAIDKTVKQIWQYGKERGKDTYSTFVSDVDFLAGENHVIFSPGGIPGASLNGKVVELDYNTREVLFQATLTPPVPIGICFHRTERLSLYP